jgi:hypothetical protein
MFLNTSDCAIAFPLPRRTGWLEKRYFRVTSLLPNGIITVIRSEIEATNATKLQTGIY